MTISLSGPRLSRPILFWPQGLATIRVKIPAIVAVIALLGCGLLIGGQYLSETSNARVMAAQVNRSMTGLMAGLAGEGVLKRDESGLEIIYFDIVFGDHVDEDYSDVAALSVFDAQGEVLKSFLALDHLSFPKHGLADLAAEAYRTTTVQEADLAGLHLIAAPVRTYDSAIVGTIAVAWDSASVVEKIKAEALRHAALALLACLVVVAVAVWFISRLVASPLARLTGRVLSIARTGDLGRHLEAEPIERNDEIGVLWREFDRMLGQLADTRQKLLEQSYYGGMAEMAAGVLHNTRNALSPITISVWNLLNTLQAPVSANLDRALDELRAGTAPEDRRGKLVDYLKLALKEQQEQRDAAATQLVEIKEQVAQLEHILRDHGLFGQGKRQLEAVALREMLDDAARTIPTGAGQPTINMAPHLGDLPLVAGQRVVLAQVFGNLFANAAESIRSAGTPQGRIEVSGACEETDGRPMVRVVVTDNGGGIDAEALGRLFERGFSTKTYKKGGIGLHWCANSLATVGGRIHAESGGPGTGASFHVLLPAWQPDDEKI